MTGTESKLDVKGEIEALTNALLTLTPSRNYLIQMFRLLPADFDSISTTYPELFDDPVARDALVRVFGLQIGDRVDLGVGLAQSLAQWSAYLTDTFGQDDSEKRWRGLSSSYGVEVPNSLVEWIETKVRMVESEPRLGGSTGKILDLLLGREQVTLSDLVKATGGDERSTRSAVNLLERMALVERVSGRAGGDSIKLKTGYSQASHAAISEGITRASRPQDGQ